MADWYRWLMSHWYWREISLTLLLLFCTWLLAHAYLILVNSFHRRWALRTATILDDQICRIVRWPGYLLIFLVGIYAAIHRYHLQLQGFLDGVLFVLSVFIIVYTIIRILTVILHWYGTRFGKDTEREAAARQLIPIADKFFKIFIVAVGLMIVLDKFRIDVKSILVTLGVGSLAIGLALQDTLANMFGGFTILLDRPFRIGDRIQLQSGELGDVQSIGLRSTSVLLPDHNLLLIPNAILVKNMVTNYSYPDSRARVVVEVGIAYGSDIDKAKALMLEAAQMDPRVLQTPPPSVLFNSFGEYALRLTLSCHVKSFMDVAVIKDSLSLAIDSKFKSSGIEIPHLMLASRRSSGC
jgi:MscS family membrane protein